VKEKIIYIVSFLLAFVLVTGLLIFLNSSYKNIFAFDFSPISQSTPITEVKKQEPQNPPAVQPQEAAQLNAAPKDTTSQKIDSTKINQNIVAVKDSSAAKKAVSEKTSKEKNKKIETLAINTATAKIESPKQIAIDKTEAKKDSIYQAWVKNTVKLYETMDSKKAAKIIQGYSDNIARDLLLTMKKKKAAEILAEFKPQVATRIISAEQ
jgi:flagellar motility protein MotE (MotC chaperone)